MKDEVTDDLWYVYYVPRSIPELMPHMAYRREKHYQTKDRKIIRCPYCGNTLTTVDVREKVEIFCHSSKAKVSWQNAIPCKKCRKTIGIIHEKIPYVV